MDETKNPKFFDVKKKSSLKDKNTESPRLPLDIQEIFPDITTKHGKITHRCSLMPETIISVTSVRKDGF